MTYDDRSHLARAALVKRLDGQLCHTLPIFNKSAGHRDCLHMPTGGAHRHLNPARLFTMPFGRAAMSAGSRSRWLNPIPGMTR